MPIRAFLFLVALGLLTVTGCGPAKLNLDKTYTIPADEGQIINLPEISKAQTIKIDFTSSDGDVTVLLFKSADVPESEWASVESKKALGEKGGKEGSFEVEVPEKTATRIVIRGVYKKTTVTLKVTNTK